jgi:hypothetical protein
MAAVYNDPTFNPVTQILLQNHMDYTEEIDLSHSKVEHMSEATPDKCQEKYSSMTLALKRQIASWEASAQGEGGMLFGDDGEEEYECSSTFEFGQLTGRPQRALERRVNFFSDVPSYLLYLWDMIETHDLRRSCLQTLVASVAAGDGGANVGGCVMADCFFAYLKQDTVKRKVRHKKLFSNGRGCTRMFFYCRSTGRKV